MRTTRMNDAIPDEDVRRFHGFCKRVLAVTQSPATTAKQKRELQALVPKMRELVKMSQDDDPALFAATVTESLEMLDRIMGRN